ncbi:flagellar biosynthesis anti-sigma factor FlgM [Deferrisoma palaeochoriense]
MKIRDVRRGYVTGTTATGRPRREIQVEEVTGIGGAVDRVDVSSRGREVQRARFLALSAPEIRADLVEAIEAEIREGRYRVTGREVLPRLLREHAWGMEERIRAYAE